jgi:hypothetical protein
MRELDPSFLGLGRNNADDHPAERKISISP